MRILIAGGGTGGHVIPALAIARELRERYGAEVRFLGTARGLETRLVPEAGFPLELIKVGQLNHVSLTTRVRTLADLPLGLARCVRLVRTFRPQVVVGVGGYASGPGMAAALLLRVPTLAFEPNAVPGMTNRLVGRWVSAAAVNFEQTRRWFHQAEVTGVPVRREFFEIAARAADGALRLLVFGGSQGARVLNEVMPGVAGPLLVQFSSLTVVHQTGGRHLESTLQAYQSSGLADAVGSGRLVVVPYLDGMVQAVAQSDLVVCRSGASTVAELAAAGRASVLVPFAAAADDHQRSNAEVLVSAGAASMLQERDLTADRLMQEVALLLADRDRRERMGQTARGLAHHDAAEAIGRQVRVLCRKDLARS